MTTQPYCPFCGAGTVISGRFDSGDSLKIVRFALDQLQVSQFSPTAKAVHVSANGSLCLHCGKVWGDADLKKAREYAELFGSEQVKKMLKASEED
jgi:hypothetical protein